MDNKCSLFLGNDLNLIQLFPNPFQLQAEDKIWDTVERVLGEVRYIVLRGLRRNYLSTENTEDMPN